MGCAALLQTAAATAAASGKGFTAGAGISCTIASSATTCETANSAKTLSATVSPTGVVTLCDRPQGAQPSCLSSTLRTGEPGFNGLTWEQTAGPFACIPVGSPYTTITGTVCTVIDSGKGFRITAGKVARVDQRPHEPEPPCTRTAIWNALKRRGAKSPDHLVGSPLCGGGYAAGTWAIDGGTYNGHVEFDEAGYLFKASAGRWGRTGRGVCEAGVIPAVVWKIAQDVCFAN